MRYNVRGGLGVQILSMIGCFADALDVGKTVSHIKLNFGNYPIHKTTNNQIWEPDIDFITPLIEFTSPVTILNTVGINKWNIFSSVKRIEQIVKHFNTIKNIISVKEQWTGWIPFRSDIPIIHCRQFDRPVVSISTYKKIVDNVGYCYLIGDDREILRQVASVKGSVRSQSTIDEWYSLYKTGKQCIGGYSSFTLSAALLNPSLKLQIVRPEYSQHLSPLHWKCVSVLISNFNNLSWYNV